MSFLPKRKTQWKKVQKTDTSSSYESPQKQISELRYAINLNACAGREVIFSEHLRPYFCNEIAKLFYEAKSPCYLVKVGEAIFDASLQNKKIDLYLSARIAQQIKLGTHVGDEASLVNIEFLPLFKVPVLQKVSIYVSNCCINLKDSYIVNKMLYNKLVNDQDVISTVYNDFRVQLSEEPGVIQGMTQLKFYSLSNFYYFFVEISQEVFDENRYVKQLNLELYIKYFKKLISRICDSHIYHEVKIVVYGRMFYPQFLNLEETQLNCIKGGVDFNSFQINWRGEVFKDYYDFLDICLPMEKEKAVILFKKVLFNFIRKLRWRLSCSEFYNLYSFRDETVNQFEGKLAPSASTNFLEALNLFLASGEIEKIKYNSNMCGIKCVVFSCGDCVYNVERYFIDLFQYIVSEEDIKIYFYAFKNQARLSSVLVRYRTYKYIQVERQDAKKSEETYNEESKADARCPQLADLNRLNISIDSFFINIQNGKEGILRKCVKHSYSKTFNQILGQSIYFDRVKDVCLRESDLHFIQQNYKGIINYKNQTNLLHLDNETIKGMYPQFGEVLTTVFKTCGHDRHYVPFDIAANFQEEEKDSKYMFLHEISFIDLFGQSKPSMGSFNLWNESNTPVLTHSKSPTPKTSTENLVRTSLHDSFFNYAKPGQLREANLLSYLKGRKNDSKVPVRGFNDSPVRPFKLKNYKKPLNDYELRLGGQGNQYTLYNLRNDSNFLDTLISNVLCKGYQLMYYNERHVMSKKETSHVISQRTSNYPKTLYTTPQKISIFGDSFVLPYSSIYRFVYHYELLQSQEKGFLHRKVEFSQLETFPWQTIENMYYSDEYTFSDMEKIHQHFWQTRYIVYYKDFDAGNKDVVEKAGQELSCFIDALNASLPLLTSVPKNRIDLSVRDRRWNYIVVESEKLMSNKMFRDEVYLVYDTHVELRNYFKFTIATMFATPIILQQLLLIIKKEVNRFNLNIKKRARKKNNLVNIVNDSVVFELAALNEKQQLDDLRAAFLGCNRLFYPYKQDEGSFSVFDNNAFLFIYITKAKATVTYNCDVKTYDENDFELVWTALKKLIAPYK